MVNECVSADFKEDVRSCNAYRAVELLKFAMKIIKRLLETRI